MNPAQNEKFVSITPPAAIVDDAAYTCAYVDTAGFAYARIFAYLGATDIAMAALKLTESDVSGSGYTDVPAADFSVTSTLDIDGTAAALPGAGDDNKAFQIQVDLRGRKRYLKLAATAGNGSAGTYLTAFALLSRAGLSPVSSAEMGCGQVLRV